MGRSSVLFMVVGLGVYFVSGLDCCWEAIVGFLDVVVRLRAEELFVRS